MVAKTKLAKVQSLTDSILANRVVGIVSVEGIKSNQLQSMRKTLRTSAKIYVVKNRLLAKALLDASKTRNGIDSLIQDISGQAGLVVSSENAFKLSKLMDSTKTPAPARGGELAPADIIVKKGATSFKPGPVVGDLQKVGIPAGIEGGKVMIKKDVTIVKKGDRISKEVAQILTMLEIYPFTAGLELKAAFEDGVRYGKKVLQIDEAAFKSNMQTAVRTAFNLALQLAYPTKVTAPVLVQTAYRHAFAVALAINLPTKETIDYLLRNAYICMIAISSKIPSALDDDLKKLVGIQKEG